jgi:hypothetical protein
MNRTSRGTVGPALLRELVAIRARLAKGVLFRFASVLPAVLGGALALSTSRSTSSDRASRLPAVQRPPGVIFEARWPRTRAIVAAEAAWPTPGVPFCRTSRNAPCAARALRALD